MHQSTQTAAAHQVGDETAKSKGENDQRGRRRAGGAQLAPTSASLHTRNSVYSKPSALTPMCARTLVHMRANKYGRAHSAPHVCV